MRIRIPLLLFFLSGLIPAPHARIQLQGYILDTAYTPVPDAYITLGDTAVSSYSDADGSFVLGEAESIRMPVQHRISTQADIRVQGTTLHMRISRTRRVRLDIFSLHGRHLHTPYDDICRRGIHRIPLTTAHASSHLHRMVILRVSTGRAGPDATASQLDIQRHVRLCGWGTQTPSLWSSAEGTTPASHALDKSDLPAHHAASTQDTLHITKAGFRAAHIVIDSYQDTLDTLMLVSNTGYPRTALHKNGLTMVVYLPDKTNGYYRGSRFDWAGMIGRVTFRGHSWYSQWQTPHDPTAHDHATGPCHEFDMDEPPGYEDAAAGESFVKIGVGLLQKPDNGSYTFYNAYTIQDPGTHTWSRTKDRIRFVHRIPTLRGIRYVYEKTLRMCGSDSSAFTIHRTLHNTGTRPIATTQYCHNFTSIDDEPIGDPYEVHFASAPQIPSGYMQGIDDKCTVNDTILDMIASPDPGDAIFTPINGLTTSAADHFARICNTATNACVAFTGSTTPHKWQLYATRSALCIEPFSVFSIPPDDSTTWETTYRFTIR